MRRDPETGMVQAIPANLDPHTVLQLYLQAPTTSAVARHLGVRRSSLLRWLKDTCPDEWKAVQTVLAHIKKEDGDAGLYDARNSLELSRAREVLRSGQFDLERLDPANWAQKQEIIGNVQPVINIAVMSYPQAADSCLPKKEADLAQVIDSKVNTI